MKRPMRVDPNPRLVWFISYAIDEIIERLYGKDKYHFWLEWASLWKEGNRSPASCVKIAHKCFDYKESAVWHCLGQLAWGAKEACYDTPASGWLVVRYIADAMVAFGVAFPDAPVAVAIPVRVPIANAISPPV